MSRLTPSRSYLGMGLGSIILRGSISVPVTFGTPENYHTESVVFDITQFNLPFNAIIGKPAPYQFMAVAHYGYLVLKMSSPNGINKILGDLSTGVSTLEKLEALAAAQEAATGFAELDQGPSSSH
jgi:hypothetical protein